MSECLTQGEQAAALTKINLFNVPHRELHKGMGQAVAERTYLRKLLTDDAQRNMPPGVYSFNSKDPHFRQWVTAMHNTAGYKAERDDTAPMTDGPPATRWENWGELADRVALGNALLCRSPDETQQEYHELSSHIRRATVIMSGRHLQHGDVNQRERPMEVFTNCSTAPTSFALFYLLLNGSGVGRCYDDDMMLVDWDNMPTVRVVLDASHPDFDYAKHMSVRDARHLYGKGKAVHWFNVPDTREGWAEAIERLEIMTYQGLYRDELLILDFSKVRAQNQPIMGMQGRPSSGPVALMNAFEKIAKIKGAGLPRWLQTLYIDHYLAEPVLVGGARRAARMSTKHWSDPDVLDFIEVKRPIEYDGMTPEQVTEYRTEAGSFGPSSFLWSSNNSVTVDEEFWRLVQLKKTNKEYRTAKAKKARAVFNRVVECSYADGTGEPGFINTHLLTSKDDGMDDDRFKYGGFMHSDRYQVTDETRLYLIRLAKTVKRKGNKYIVNPCGEIVLSCLGAFCVIADVVLYHAESLEDAENAVRATTRSLIRVNTMDSLYRAEVTRTNRIGVGQTGIHEFAWKFFEVGFNDLVNPDFKGWLQARKDLGIKDDWTGKTNPDPRIRAAAFWHVQGHMSRAIHDEAQKYSEELGVTPPHTDTTLKPSGSVSKLFGLTEAAHLPAMLHYMRWVQFTETDPLVMEYEAKGYPVRSLKDYKGHVIVGFPTAPVITELGMGDALVTAGDARMTDQYKWLHLLEAFWLEGSTVESYIDKDVPAPLPKHGNQVSYTMKYKPDVTSLAQFKKAVMDFQSTVRCVSVMPQEDTSAYEYLPEESVSKAEFEATVAKIKEAMQEDIGREHIDCDGGACPVNFAEIKGVA